MGSISNNWAWLTSECTVYQATQMSYPQEPGEVFCDSILRQKKWKNISDLTSILPDTTMASLGPQVWNPQVILLLFFFLVFWPVRPLDTTLLRWWWCEWDAVVASKLTNYFLKTSKYFFWCVWMWDSLRVVMETGVVWCSATQPLMDQYSGSGCYHLICCWPPPSLALPEDYVHLNPSTESQIIDFIKDKQLFKGWIFKQFRKSSFNPFDDQLLATVTLSKDEFWVDSVGTRGWF